MKNVLIVSFYFPPIMSAASVRTGKFAKYLPEYGWKPIVLTVKPKGILTQGIPVEVDEASIHRTAYHDPIGHFSSLPGEQQRHNGKAKRDVTGNWKGRAKRGLKKISPFTIQRMPDRMLGWYFYAVKEARKMMGREKIDAVFSSHPPPVSHLVASKIHKETGLPWVADYRDLWTGSTLKPYPRWLEGLEKRFERRSLREAAGFITVSGKLQAYLTSLHGKPVKVIYNGFDPEDFKGVSESRETGEKTFTLVYSGTLYTKKQSPAPFFKALEKLKGKGKINGDNFVTRFIGVQEPPFQEMVRAHNLEDIVQSEPFQPYKDNIAALKSATALLFFSWNAGEMAGNPTSKIFQYAGAGRPILVVGEQNRFAVDFVEKSQTGEVGRGAEGIISILEGWMGQIEKKGRLDYTPLEKAVMPYNRKLQAKKLAGILNDVIQTV